jgi:hypothetical protein
MSDSNYPNRHQYAFLRKVRNHPNGIPAEQMPHPSTLKRWLRQPGFCRAMKGLIATFRVEEDLFAAGAAAHAGQMLFRLMAGGCIGAVENNVRAVNALCRVIRQDQVRRKPSRSRAQRAAQEQAKPAKKPAYTPPTEPTVEEAKAACEKAEKDLAHAKSRLLRAERIAEADKLKRPFPNPREGCAAWYNPITNRREMPETDVPEEEAGLGMDRMEKWIHEAAEAVRQRRQPGEPLPWKKNSAPVVGNAKPGEGRG